MTDSALLFAAIGVPWAAGTALLGACGTRHGPESRPRNWSGWLFRVAAGFFLGQVLVMAWLYLSLRLTHNPRPGGGIAVMGALAACGFLWPRVRKHPSQPGDADSQAADAGAEFAPDTSRPQPTAPDAHGRGSSSGADYELGRGDGLFAKTCGLILAVGFVALMAARLSAIAQAAVHVPVRGEDAHVYWLYKAKVITELGVLPSDPADPYYLGGSNPAYPVFPALMAAWLPIARGGWSEALPAMTWAMIYVNLCLLVFAGSCRWMPPIAACCIAGAVSSMPLLVVHAYRPGYADMPLSAFLVASVFLLMNWRAGAGRASLAAALVFAGAAAACKREGPAVAAMTVGAFIPAAILDLRRRALPLRTCVPIVVTGAVLAAVIGSVVDVRDLARDASAMEYHPEAWAALARHALTWSSFHVIAWLVPPAMLAVLLLPRTPLTGPALLLAVLLPVLWAAIFVLTPNARFALNDQTPSRSALQVAPSVVAALAAAVGAGLGRQARSGACPGTNC